MEKPNPPSFDDVYERYFSFVRNTAFRMGVAEAYLDDVCQDVFVAVYRQLPEFQAKSTVKTWLFGFVFNVVRDHHRTLRRKSVAHRAAGELVDPDTLSDRRSRTQEEYLDRVEAAHLVEKALASLDSEKRAMFILSEFEGMRGPEIAEAMSTSVEATYSRLRRARREFSKTIRRLMMFKKATSRDQTATPTTVRASRRQPRQVAEPQFSVARSSYMARAASDHQEPLPQGLASAH